MLRAFTRNGNQLMLSAELPAAVEAEGFRPVWFDLVNPTTDEDKLVEERVGIKIPTREEMQEIEVSARLYQEDGAEFMTITAVTQLDTEEPVTSPITFVLKGNTLISVRYAEPKAFTNYALRAQKPAAVACANGEQIMMGLIEALFDRMADALERVGADIDGISRQVFRKKPGAKSAPKAPARR